MLVSGQLANWWDQPKLLCSCVHPSEYRKTISIDEVPYFPYDLRGGRINSKLWDCDTEKMVYSGHDIIFKTEDPDAYPLPSKKILICSGY
jgi:hypothetical protein